MVQAPRTTARARGIRRLNVPQEIEVRTAPPSSRLPKALKERGGQWAEVAALEDSWRVEDEWWREVSLARTYYQVTLDDGRPLTFFLDEMTGRWHSIRVSVQPRSA